MENATDLTHCLPRISAFARAATSNLSQELGDHCTAAHIAPAILDAGFNMTPPSAAIDEASLLIAFAFGNRPNAEHDANQLALPGPMNLELARCCAAVWQKKALPMFVQWEIGRCLQQPEFAHIPRCDIISIEPYWNAAGQLVYLSTDGVVQAIVEKYYHNNPATMGRAAVIGHRDHVKRCILTCAGREVSGFAPRGIALPQWYDEQSDQPWTRRRDLYVLQDIAAQLSMRAQANIAGAYPQG